MSDNNLRLQVILNAVDKLTRPFRSAQTSSKELAAAIQQSRTRLKELDTQAGKIDGFRKASAQLAVTGNNLKAAREEAAKLATQFSATNRPTAAQARLLGQAKSRVTELQSKYNGLRQSVQRQRLALNEAGLDTKKLSSAQRELRQNADETRQALDRQQKSLKRLGEQQARMNAARDQYSRSLETRDRIAGAGATTTAAGVAMGAPVMAAVKSYSSMEDAMKGVAKQMNGLRDDNGNRTKQYYDMQDAIKAASENLPMENGAIDYAALVEGGARMGVTNQADPYEDQKRDLLAFASTAAKAATAFELPADELAEGLGKIAQLYKVPTRNIEQLGDALNYLDDNAMSKGGDIIDVLQRMGGVADRLDYRKAAALGSTFLSLGAAPEIAASASNAMVRELSIATMQSKRFFEGMDLLKLNPAEIEKQMTTDAMGTIQRVLKKVNNLPQDKRLSAMTMIFGKEFGDDAAKLANNLPELQRQLKLTSGSNANGSMQKESDINKDSLSAQWLLVKTGAQNTFSSLGETLREPLMAIMGTVKQVTGALRRWVEENPKLAGTLLKVVAAIAAVAAAMGTMMLAVSAILGPLALMRLQFSVLGIKGGSAFGLISKAIGSVGKGIMWLGRLMFANPILAVIGLIAMGAVYIWQNWDTLGPKFKAMWDAVCAATAAAWEWIKQAVSNAWESIKFLFFNYTLPGLIAKNWDAIRAGVSDAWASIRQAISDKWAAILADVAALPAKFQDMGSAIIDGILNGINARWEALKSKLSSVTEYLPDWMTGNNSSGKTQVQVVSGAASVPFSGMYDSGGTIPRGQFGIVGENGPEIVNGPVNITSRRRTAALASMVAGVMGVAAAPAEAAPLHPFSLPARAYQTQSVKTDSQPSVIRYEINAPIHIVAQPGQSAQDIAREVARQLDERERRARAKARSNFSDQGGYDS
ncbi:MULTISPECIES: phage tail tape measure protein [Salmonella]|uniref:phage tail tape measure protein n=1 Tax=Salmonella TaxID=590 RepID=UPI000F9B05CC|nr:phage tail tape measure protein [Salmonella enterica]ECG6046298.1 phage tail tape measure protein [Salmonella enterica subsp. enterica serovar Isangi]EEA0830277.1 phage tail tape measure protein [Salmonella enterica subsp. enterica serovar Virchow]MBJ2415372.1 phage tail tape measure protein [Salmonella enterica subsp. enterica serovar Rissen]MKA40145.1 phage tail tape measure protein [Salmonella enterica subsp. enterica serovar Ohio]HEC7876134.1 phage tail tape measure protein [Salmonella 